MEPETGLLVEFRRHHVTNDEVECWHGYVAEETERNRRKQQLKAAKARIKGIC